MQQSDYNLKSYKKYSNMEATCLGGELHPGLAVGSKVVYFSVKSMRWKALGRGIGIKVGVTSCEMLAR